MTDSANPLHGKIDLDNLATAGHSRGAKIAALHFAGAPDTTDHTRTPPVAYLQHGSHQPLRDCNPCMSAILAKCDWSVSCLSNVI